MTSIEYEGWIDVLVYDPILGCSDSMRFNFNKPSPKPTHKLTYLPLGAINCQGKDTFLPTEISVQNLKSPVKYYIYDPQTFISLDSGTIKDTVYSLPFIGAGKIFYMYFVDSIGCTNKVFDTFYKKSNVRNTYIPNVEPPNCYNQYNGSIEVVTVGVYPLKFIINDTIIVWDSVSKKYTNLFIQYGSVDSVHLVIQDAMGCVFDTIIKGIKDTFFFLDAKIGVENISCGLLQNGKITITPPTRGFPPYSYSLDNQNYQSSNIFDNLGEGNYTVWVKDFNNCPSRFLATISKPSDLKVSIIKDDVACHGDKSGIVSVQAIGGKSPYQMTWNGQLFGALPATIYDLDSGKYTIRVIDANNCLVDTFVLISTNPPIITSYALDSIQCHNASDGKINIQSAGGKGNFQYSKNGINYSTNPVFSNLNAGSYTFYSKDGAGCIDTVAIRLQNPPAIAIQLIKKTDLTCFQKNDGKIEISYSGPHPPLRLKWNDNDTLAIRDSLMAGSYSATVSNTHNCKQSLVVSIMQADSFYILSKNIENVRCFGEKTGSIEIASKGGQKPIEYRWSTGDTSSKIEKLKGASLYALTATDANGCAVKNQFFVDENQSLKGNIISKNITCYDGYDGEIKTQGIGGKPPYTYQLDSLQRGSKNIFRNLTSKSFKIAIFDSNMCQWDTTLVLSSPPKPILALPRNYQVVLGESTLLIPILNAYPYKNISFKWEPNYDLNCADCKETQFIGYQNNNYTFYVSYANNQCLDSANTSVVIKQDDKQRYYIPNAFSPLLPSAENKIFRIYGNYIKSIDLKVFNRWGEKVFESQSVENSWDGMYRGAPAVAGTYSYTATIEFLDKKIVKTNGFVILFW
jgi:gliding motility-associated-like protein